MLGDHQSRPMTRSAERAGADVVPAALPDETEEDALADMALPKEHRAKIHSSKPLERLNGCASCTKIGPSLRPRGFDGRRFIRFRSRADAALSAEAAA